MRIHAKELKYHLQRTLAPLYFIFGEEPLQRKETLDCLRAKAKASDFLEREVIDCSHPTLWTNLITAEQHFSLFGAKRLIECHFTDNKIPKEAQEYLLNLKPSPDILFIFIFPHKVSATLTNAAWFKSLEAFGVGITTQALNTHDFLHWLQERLNQYHIQVTKEALALLQDRTQGNLLAAANAIEKISLFYNMNSDNNMHNGHNAHNMLKTQNNKILDVQEIREIVSVDARFTLFDLVDTMLQGNTLRTIQIFKSLKNDRIDPILVLWVLTREVRTIIPLATLATQGRLKKESYQEHGVWQYRTALVAPFIKRCSLNTLQQSLITAKTIDDLIKRSLLEDAWRILLSLTLQLAGVKNV